MDPDIVCDLDLDFDYELDGILRTNFPELFDEHGGCDVGAIFDNSGLTGDVDSDAWLQNMIGLIDSDLVSGVSDRLNVDEIVGRGLPDEFDAEAYVHAAPVVGSGKDKIISKNVCRAGDNRTRDVIVVGTGISRGVPKLGGVSSSDSNCDDVAGPSGVRLDNSVGVFCRHWTPVKEKGKMIKYRDGKRWRDLYNVCRAVAMKYFVKYKVADCLPFEIVDDEVLGQLKDKGMLFIYYFV